MSELEKSAGAEGRAGPMGAGLSVAVALGSDLLGRMSEDAVSELCESLMESGQCDQAWETLCLSGRQELLPGIAQSVCAKRRVECERFAELGAKAAAWALRELGGADETRLGDFLSEALVVRNEGFLARAQSAVGVGELARLARSGALFCNGMTLANARRLSWAFDALDESFERACIERDLSGPRMLLRGAPEEPEMAGELEYGEGRPRERRRFGGFGLLGLATGRHEPFKRALALLLELGFDVESETRKRSERRSYGGMSFPPHNCVTAALLSGNEANARLMMRLCPAMSPEREMRELAEGMDGDSGGEREQEDLRRARALACALEIERAAGGAGAGSKGKSRAL